MINQEYSHRGLFLVLIFLEIEPGDRVAAVEKIVFMLSVLQFLSLCFFIIDGIKAMSHR